MGFDGLAEETDGDLRVAWRTQLAREGKLDPGGGQRAQPGPRVRVLADEERGYRR